MAAKYRYRVQIRRLVVHEAEVEVIAESKGEAKKKALGRVHDSDFHDTGLLEGNYQASIADHDPVMDLILGGGEDD